MYSNYGWRGDWAGSLNNFAGHPWILTALAIAAPIFVVLIFWSLFWKGLALWHSAIRGQYWWFLILLLVNTLGILEIIYLFGVAKLHFHDLFSEKPHHHN